MRASVSPSSGQRIFYEIIIAPGGETTVDVTLLPATGADVSGTILIRRRPCDASVLS